MLLHVILQLDLLSELLGIEAIRWSLQYGIFIEVLGIASDIVVWTIYLGE
jgi:hypothetical protein